MKSHQYSIPKGKKHAPNSDYMDCEKCDFEPVTKCLICGSILCYWHSKTHWALKTKTQESQS